MANNRDTNYLHFLEFHLLESLVQHKDLALIDQDVSETIKFVCTCDLGGTNTLSPSDIAKRIFLHHTPRRGGMEHIHWSMSFMQRLLLRSYFTVLGPHGTPPHASLLTTLTYDAGPDMQALHEQMRVLYRRILQHLNSP